MIRLATMAAVVLTAAATLPAAAQGITVKVAGKSAAAVLAEVQRAARQVCAADADPQLGVPHEPDLAQCERLTARRAMDRIAQVTIARTPATQVAALSPAKPH